MGKHVSGYVCLRLCASNLPASENESQLNTAFLSPFLKYSKLMDPSGGSLAIWRYDRWQYCRLSLLQTLISEFWTEEVTDVTSKCWNPYLKSPQLVRFIEEVPVVSDYVLLVPPFIFIGILGGNSQPSQGARTWLIGFPQHPACCVLPHDLGTVELVSDPWGDQKRKKGQVL